VLFRSHRSLHYTAATTGALGVFSTVFFIVALLLAVFAKDMWCAEVAFWVLGYGAWFVVIFAQGVGLYYSNYGEERLPGHYNILARQDFYSYWNKYMGVTATPSPEYYMDKGVPLWLFANR
jgi:hypothetical protein